MAQSPSERILQMQRDKASGDERISSYDRQLRTDGYEHLVNVPAPAIDLLELAAEDTVTVDLYLDRIVLRPDVGETNE